MVEHIGATTVCRAKQLTFGPYRDGENRDFSKYGHKSHVLCDYDAARVVGIAIVPVHEAGTSVRCGTDFNGSALVKGAAACNGAQQRIVCHHGDGVLWRAIEMEHGFIIGVACHSDVTWVAGNAVAPTEESVVFIRRGSQCDDAAVVVCTGTTYRTTIHRVTFRSDFILQRLEDGSVGGIAFNNNGSRVGGFAIVPLVECIACVVVGGQSDGVTVVISASTSDGACVCRHDLSLYEALLDSEMCSEGHVVCDDDFAWVVGVAIVPTDK